MNKILRIRDLFLMTMVAIMSTAFVSCSDDEDNKREDSKNTSDVAVTSNVVKFGATYARIEGYVNLNLITSTYTKQRVGVELSVNEDFDGPIRVETNAVEGNKITVEIETLSAQTKYFYRTFVEINNLYYYGEKRSFTTKDFSNLTTTGNASDITLTSATIDFNVDASSVDTDEFFEVGIVYSTNKNQLHPDTISKVKTNYGYNSSNGLKVKYYYLDDADKKAYNTNISDLQIGTTYYYCSYTGAGYEYKLGEIKSFSTQAISADNFSTGDATDITITSATLKGYSSLSTIYTKTDEPIRYAIRYSTNNNLNESKGNYETVSPVLEGNELSAKINKLQANTTYYYCFVAEVDKNIFLSEVKEFTTKGGADYLIIDENVSVSATIAILKGTTNLSSIYPNNTDIEYNIRYATIATNLTSTNSYYSTEVIKDGDKLSGIVRNLISETTYYYCIVAYVDGMYIYSNIKNFTTLSDYSSMDYNDEDNLWKAVDEGPMFDGFFYWFVDNGWSLISNSNATHNGDTYELILPEGMGASQWQGQFFIKTKLKAKAGKKYIFYCVMEADKYCPQVTFKFSDANDDDYYFFEERHDVLAHEPFLLKKEGISLMKFRDVDALHLHFDFGGSPSGTKVKIRSIIFKEVK